MPPVPRMLLIPLMLNGNLVNGPISLLLSNGKKGGKIQWYIDGNLFHQIEHKDQALKVVGDKVSLGIYQSNPALNRYVLDGKLDEVRLSLRIKTKQEIGESMRAIQPSHKLAISWSVSIGGLVRLGRD